MKKRSVIITGASGFIGRNLVENLKDDFTIYAVARRSAIEAHVPSHPNITWIQYDIANPDMAQEVGAFIKKRGGAEILFHMAAFYDFTYADNPEYARSNITGARNVLELGKRAGINCFVFSSSLAACEFPRDGRKINEESPLDAPYAYAESKRAGEAMLREYTDFFSCFAVRYAAIFSDWCEYAPLYKFLETWLGRNYDARILAGRGKSAIPYLHIHDLCGLFRVLINSYKKLPRFQVLIASPDGATSHLELFRAATKIHYARTLRPLHLPRPLAFPGILARQIPYMLHLTRKEPFEKLWMAKYIDLALDTDAARTRELLGWQPTPRYHISRRLLFLIEKMKSRHDEWVFRNEAAFRKTARRKNICVYTAMGRHRETILNKLPAEIKRSPDLGRYRDLPATELSAFLATLYDLIMTSVRTNDRDSILQFIHDNFTGQLMLMEIAAILEIFADLIPAVLGTDPEIQNIGESLHPILGMTFQLALDETQDILEDCAVSGKGEPSGKDDLKKRIKKMTAAYRPLSDAGIPQEKKRGSRRG